MEGAQVKPDREKALDMWWAGETPAAILKASGYRNVSTLRSVLCRARNVDKDPRAVKRKSGRAEGKPVPGSNYLAVAALDSITSLQNWQVAKALNISKQQAGDYRRYARRKGMLAA
jgi:hypothetical protein